MYSGDDGHLPPRHGVRNNRTSSLPGEAVTLAESLAANGYEAAAFIGAPVLDEEQGLDPGFEV